jgi:hypothetical protein
MSAKDSEAKDRYDPAKSALHASDHPPDIGEAVISNDDPSGETGASATRPPDPGEAGVLQDRYDLAEKVFDGVMDSVVHLDGKASRILAAIAFLTAAAAAVFARAASPYPPASEVAQRLAPELSQYLQGQDSVAVARSIASTLTTPRLLVFGHDASVVFFLVYLMLTLLGSAFYLVVGHGPTDG